MIFNMILKIELGVAYTVNQLDRARLERRGAVQMPDGNMAVRFDLGNRHIYFGTMQGIKNYTFFEHIDLVTRVSDKLASPSKSLSSVLVNGVHK